jgi:hypothetical protein
MKKLLFLFVFAGIARLVSAQSDQPVIQSADPNAPEITFVESVIDFGNISEGEQPVKVFTFTNTGKTNLVISAVKGQCGCTTILTDTWIFPRTIAPGETASFKVMYDTKTRVGMFNKKIMVYCNASNATNGVYSVSIKGNVTPATPGH